MTKPLVAEIPTSELSNHIGDVIYCKATNIYNKVENTGPASRRFFILDSKASEPADEELIIESDDDAPFAALAFKVMTDPYVGKLTFFRVYSGTLQSGSYVLNATKGKKERIGRILQMHANNRKEISEVYTGDIAAAVGLKNTTTGDTLCDEKKAIITRFIADRKITRKDITTYAPVFPEGAVVELSPRDVFDDEDAVEFFKKSPFPAAYGR